MNFLRDHHNFDGTKDLRVIKVSSDGNPKFLGTVSPSKSNPAAANCGKDSLREPDVNRIEDMAVGIKKSWGKNQEGAGRVGEDTKPVPLIAQTGR
jgi:hypothetical protein